MKHDYIEEHNIVDRFLMGRLPAEEAEAFQDHTMTCRRCLDDLAHAERMQRGIRTLYETETTLGWTPLAAFLSRWYARGPWIRGMAALAAMVLLTGPALFLGWRMLDLERQLDDARVDLANLEHRDGQGRRGPRTNVPIFRLSPQRSAATSRPASFTVRLGPSSQWLVLVLEVDTPTDARGNGPWQARLHDQDNRELWTTSGLTADPLGEVAIGLQAESLAAGDYALILTRETDDGSSRQTAPFAFRVIRDP